MINWCNQNQGFLMVVLTFIYVIATIAICLFNYKTIVEQKRLHQEAQKVSLFSLCYDVYKQFSDEIHLWRFSNNNQVLDFFRMRNKADVLLYLSIHCQDYYYLSTKANLLFDKEICKSIDMAWKIIRNEIYPSVRNVVTELPMEVPASETLIKIKHAMSESPLKEAKNRLFTLEVEISALIEEEIQIRNLK